MLTGYSFNFSPNGTGKSSLLNALVGYDRAIVSPIAGTTRDSVEQKVHLGKVCLHLHDTAGVHQTEDIVEKMGVERSLRLAKDAELILFVLDGSEQIDAEDQELMEKLEGFGCPVVCVCNKNDRHSAIPAEISEKFAHTLSVSALTGKGIDTLKQKIEELFVSGVVDYDTTPILTGAHRHAMIATAIDLVQKARDAVSFGISPDMAALDLEMASAELGRLDGRAVSEEVVGSIFSRFCVGK